MPFHLEQGYILGDQHDKNILGVLSMLFITE